MKKCRLLLLLLALVLLTGCEVVKINTNNNIKNINTILSRKSKYVNKDAIGYQYYLPNGVISVETRDFNQKFLSDGVTYYLYTDIVSYYYKTVLGYEINKKAYISEELAYNNKRGYIEVNEENGKYFVEMMFNYAKIESYVEKDKLNDTLINMAYILSSVKYNDDIIDSLVKRDNGSLSNNETYNIFETKKSTSQNFLMYYEEYGKYEGEDAANLIEKNEIKQEKDN